MAIFMEIFMGIFDHSRKGAVTPPVEVTLERGPLVFFSKTIGETAPIYHNTAAAQAAGHPDIMAPPTYAMVISALADQRAKEQGRPDVSDLINVDFHALRHGSESYTYHGLMYAGDTVIVDSEITNFAKAKDGKLEIAYITTRISHPTRGLLVEASRTLVHHLN